MLEGSAPQHYADDMAVELVHDAGHFVAEDGADLVAQRALALFAARPRS